MDNLRFAIDPAGLEALGRALRAEDDGRELRKELARGLRRALNPARQQARASIMSMTSAGSGGNPGLRSRVAQKIMPEVKLGGNWTGARLKAKRIPEVRSFTHAPKRLNRAGGFQATSWGRGKRVQLGKPGWFDEPAEASAPRAREAALAALADMAERIASRAGTG